LCKPVLMRLGASHLSDSADWCSIGRGNAPHLLMVRVFRAATDGPADLRALLAALRNRLG
jgi:hypothetical protein